jgi:hypothetical protein
MAKIHADILYFVREPEGRCTIRSGAARRELTA